MQPQDYQDVFTSFGQLIGLRNAAEYYNTNTNQVRALSITALLTNYFNEVNKIQPAVQSMLSGIQSQSTNLLSTIDTIIANYLLQVVKPLISSTKSTATLVLDDMIADMGYPLNAETVLTAGKFYTYFYNAYGKELPTDGSPTIADSLAN